MFWNQICTIQTHSLIVWYLKIGAIRMGTINNTTLNQLKICKFCKIHKIIVLRNDRQNPTQNMVHVPCMLRFMWTKMTFLTCMLSIYCTRHVSCNTQGIGTFSQHVTWLYDMNFNMHVLCQHALMVKRWTCMVHACCMNSCYYCC